DLCVHLVMLRRIVVLDRVARLLVGECRRGCKRADDRQAAQVVGRPCSQCLRHSDPLLEMSLIQSIGKGRPRYSRPSMLAMNICFISGTPAGTGLPPVDGSSNAAFDSSSSLSVPTPSSFSVLGMPISCRSASTQSSTA